MVQAINPDRIVPVTEDLTTPYNQFEVVRGWETMKRVDKPLATGVTALQGEWLVLGDNGKLALPTITPVPNSYPVLAGTDRFDVAANKAATIIMDSKVIVRTTKYDAGGTYNVGTPLTVKLVGGIGVVTPASIVADYSASDPVLARVTAIPANGVIEYEIL